MTGVAYEVTPNSGRAVDFVSYIILSALAFQLVGFANQSYGLGIQHDRVNYYSFRDVTNTIIGNDLTVPNGHTGTEVNPYIDSFLADRMNMLKMSNPVDIAFLPEELMMKPENDNNLQGSNNISKSISWNELSHELFGGSRGFTKEEAELHAKLLNNISEVEEQLF